jgi:hypothetical protein
MNEDAVAMQSNASRSAAVIYDQFEDDQRLADWGADELFTRMPRPRLVDDGRTPAKQRRAEPARPAGAHRQRAAETRRFVAAQRAGPDRRRRRTAAAPARPAAEPTASAVRPKRPLELVAPPADHGLTSPGEVPGAPIEPLDAASPTTTVPLRPARVPRPLPIVPSPRRRPARGVADWIGPRPERLVAWAFVLGLLLVMIAITTADAATV